MNFNYKVIKEYGIPVKYEFSSPFFYEDMKIKLIRDKYTGNFEVTMDIVAKGLSVNKLRNWIKYAMPLIEHLENKYAGQSEIYPSTCIAWIYPECLKEL